MDEFEKFELGDLVFSNEDHPFLDVESESPGLVIEVIEDTFGTQVEVAVEFYPDNNEVRFAPHELTIVGRNGELTTFEDVIIGDHIMMINPDGELVEFLVEDALRNDDLVNIYGSDAEDQDATASFVMPVSGDVFKVSA